MGWISKLFSEFNNRSKIRAMSEPLAPKGSCVFAIGDVHGCLFELKGLLSLIEKECDLLRRQTPDTEITIIFLGDMIDRGPDSKGVVDFLLSYQPDFAELVFLSGNHEEILLKLIDGEQKLLPLWIEHGGRECANSYGVNNLGMISYRPEAITMNLASKVPASHSDFIRSFRDYFVFGDYLFVHAGIMPNVALEKQTAKNLKWIREPFLSHKGFHEYCVVHGHTVVTDLEIHPNRIAVDTGAYKTGKLSCLKISELETSTLSFQSR